MLLNLCFTVKLLRRSYILTSHDGRVPRSIGRTEKCKPVRHLLQATVEPGSSRIKVRRLACILKPSGKRELTRQRQGWEDNFETYMRDRLYIILIQT